MTDLTHLSILAPVRFLDETLATLAELFDLRFLNGSSVDVLTPDERRAVRGVAVAGRFNADMMRMLPNFEIIAHFGVGYDGIDTAHAVSSGIAVTNTPDVLDEEVADTALGLLLNTVREFAKAESYLRSGRWAADGPYPLTAATLRGRRVGIMGLGRIGLAIARRIEAFGLPISYHNRTRRDDVSYPYYATLEALAEAVDTLIVAAPGGAQTQNAVDAGVLAALGADGILLNIGRGSIVDEAALVSALHAGTIRAAGLDVFSNEPNVSQALLAAPNTVLLPHVASASRATRRAMGNLVIENLRAWFEGDVLPTPVPETRRTGLIRRPN